MHYWRLDQVRHIYYILIIILICCPVKAADSDIPRWKTEGQLGQPLFTISTHRRLVDDPEKVGFDVLVEVMNDMLLFVRDKGKFRASMELTLTISDKKHDTLTRKVKHVSREVDDFEPTNSKRDFVVTPFSLELDPGKYKVKVQLEDLESRQRRSVEKEVILAKSAGDLIDISDIILACSSQLDTAGHLPIYLTVSGLVSKPSASLYCFFDLKRWSVSGDCQIRLSVVDKSGKPCYADSLSIIGGSEISSYFMRIPTENLNFNRYKAFIEAGCGGSVVSRQAEFRVDFHGLPWIIGDLDQAVDQLRYVASNEEIKRLKNEFPSRREEAFIKFWNDKFPVENELVNGKMVEYYNRVQIANQNFSNNRAGWETDRGRIYIIYGQPDEVERNDADVGSVTYEVWYYNRQNKRFIFRDEFGFGEYRLVNTAW